MNRDQETSYFSTLDLARTHRREFLTRVGAAAGLACLPGVVTAQKTDSRVIVGSGDHRYEAHHDWAQLPPQYTWQTTHNVTCDRSGNVYVIHEGKADQKDHPSIFAFDSEGKFLRAFGQQYQGGGHGLEYRHEADGEFLYITAYKHLHTFAKLDLQGEVVWSRSAPMEAKCFVAGEDTRTNDTWGRDRFHPTNTAFLPDGAVLLADGYGSYRIHQYDAAGAWKSCFGGTGKGAGEFDLPHGVWVDTRAADAPKIVVADRQNARLQWFTLAGEHLLTLGDFILPANIDIYQDTMLVPDLAARVTLLDKENKVIAHLGEDPEWRSKVMDGMKIRGNPKEWPAGKFIHPHDACFTATGDIMVAEWVATGRITKLRRLF